MMEGVMNTSAEENNRPETAARPVTNVLHPRVYAALIGLALWFALSIWSFAGAGVTDYLLFIVSAFIFVAVALPLILSRVGRGHDAANEGVANDKPHSFHNWMRLNFETMDSQLSATHAAVQILLPIAAAAFGMTAFGIVFLIVEHGGV
jgi:hypothetical protein